MFEYIYMQKDGFFYTLCKIKDAFLAHNLNFGYFPTHRPMGFKYGGLTFEDSLYA